MSSFYAENPNTENNFTNKAMQNQHLCVPPCKTVKALAVRGVRVAHNYFINHIESTVRRLNYLLNHILCRNARRVGEVGCAPCVCTRREVELSLQLVMLLLWLLLYELYIASASPSYRCRLPTLMDEPYVCYILHRVGGHKYRANHILVLFAILSPALSLSLSLSLLHRVRMETVRRINTQCAIHFCKYIIIIIIIIAFITNRAIVFAIRAHYI